MHDGKNRGEDARSVLALLLHTAGAVEGRLGRAVEASGLSLAKLGVLRSLVAEGGSMPLGRLAGLLACVKSNVTQLVDRLEADGLVRREADADDRRSTLAVITEEGRRRCEQASRAHDEAAREILRGMPPARRAQLAALLRAVGTALGGSEFPSGGREPEPVRREG